MAPRLTQKESWSLLPSSHHDPEKARLQSHYIQPSPSARQEEDVRLRERMPSPKYLLTTVVVAFLVTLGLAAAVVPRDGMPCHGVRGHHDQTAPEIQGPIPEPDSRNNFADLLEQVSPSSLHRLLSTYFPRRYRHGVFESEHHALEAVHADDPELASTIVQVAKRQENNSTDTSTDTATDTAGPGSNTPTPSPTPTPSEDPNTNTNTQTPKPSPNTNTPDPTPTPSPTPDPQPTNTPTQEPTRQETTTTADPEPTKNDETTTTPTSPANTNQSPSASTPAETTTTKPTKPTSVSVRKTSTPVTATITSTKPNGDVTVVTTTSFVEANVPVTETGEAGSLQTEDAASLPTIPALPALAGAILGGLALI